MSSGKASNSNPHVGSKRNRRLRSNAGQNGGGETKRNKGQGGGQGNNAKADTSKVPIFLRKTYDMIDNCDSTIACWTEDGDMFVVKDQKRFEKEEIPKYFDHNKFSSFNRQLNFYGFRKIQSKPIRNEDIDQSTLKHITFYNENFKRGHRELMIHIQRSTRTGGSANAQEQQKEIEALKHKVVTLESQVQYLYQVVMSQQEQQQHGQGQPSTYPGYAANGAGTAAVPVRVGSQPTQAHDGHHDYYDGTYDGSAPGGGKTSPHPPSLGKGGSGVPTSIAVHDEHQDHYDTHMSMDHGNGKVASKEATLPRHPDAKGELPTEMPQTTLPRHPNSKGGLPSEMNALPAELERGVSSLSLLRGLSSGFDPNLSLLRGMSTANTSTPSKEHDPNDPMLSQFDKKFFNTLINETNSGDGAGGGSGGGPRVASTAGSRKVFDPSGKSMVNSKQV